MEVIAAPRSRINAAPGDGKPIRPRESPSSKTPQQPPREEVATVLKLLFEPADEQEEQQGKQLEGLRALIKTCGSSESQQVVGALLEGFGSAGELLAVADVAVEVEVSY